MAASRHNLPVQPTPLIGREREVRAACELLLRDDVRLVTLTGPGGTGKTRVGIEAAAVLLGPLAGSEQVFPDGVVFVGLGAISDPLLVVPTIAQAVGVRSIGTIANDVEALRAKWHDQAWRTYDAHVDEMLARIETVETEAWAAWERSKSQQGTTATKIVREGNADAPSREEASDRRQDRDGDPRFLTIILECQDRRARILGLKDAGKVMPMRPGALPPPPDPDPVEIEEVDTRPQESALAILTMIADAGGIEAWKAIKAAEAAEAEEDEDAIDTEVVRDE